MSCAGKMYHMSLRTHIELKAHMNAACISIQYALNRIKISAKLYILSKIDYPNCENYYFEKITFTVRELHTILHIIIIQNQY